MADEPSIDLSGSEGTTLTEVLAAYAAGGFSSSFTVTQESLLECHTCSETSAPSEVEMSSLRRMEGESDPDDMMAVAAITCPKCQAQGTVLLGFGPTATAEDSDVLGALRDSRHDDAAPGNSAPGEAAGDDSAADSAGSSTA